MNFLSASDKHFVMPSSLPKNCFIFNMSFGKEILDTKKDPIKDVLIGYNILYLNL